MPRPQIITANGNAQVSTAQSKFGGSSLAFDGSGDYLTTTYSSEFWKWNETDYTIEFWGRFNSVTGGSIPVQIGLMAPTGGLNYWSFGIASGQIIFYYWNGSTNSVNSNTTINALNAWDHFAFVYTKSNNTIKLFYNGTNIASEVVSGTPQFQDVGATVISIGQFNNTAMNGYLDEIRVSNNARYTSNFTPATSAFTNDANTLLLIHADGTNGSTSIVDDYPTGVIEQGAAVLTSTSSINCIPGDADPFYIESGYIDAGYYESFLILQEFESNLYSVATLNSSVGLIKNASVALTTISNLSSPIELIKNALVALTATTSVSCTISHIEGADLFAFTEAAIAVQVDRIRDNNIAATSVFSVATDVERIQQGDADANAIFSAIINGLRSRDVNLDAQAAFSFNVQEDLFKDFVVSISSDISVIADVQVTREAISALDAESNITALPDKVKIISESLSSEFAVSIVADRFRDDSSAMLGVFSLEAELSPVGAVVVLAEGNFVSEFLIVADTDISLTKSSDVNLDSQFSLEANANYIVDNVIITDSIASILTAVVKTVAVQIPLDCNTVVSADASRSRSTEVSLSINATLDVLAVKTTSTSSTISSEFTQTATANRIRNVSASIEALASKLTAVVRIAGLLSDFAVVSTLTASGVVNRGARGAFTSIATLASLPIKQVSTSALITSRGTVSAIIGVRKPLSAAFTSALTFVVAIRDLRLDEIVYVIPGENYVYKIISESRLHDIYGETRIRSVIGESRIRTITGESRIETI